MGRVWTCRRCRQKHPRIKQLCPCGGKRPARQTASQRALVDSYDDWVREFGTVCMICGREPSERRRLDRDHCHVSGRKRGLLCARCNRALPSWVDAQWLRKATFYLEQFERRQKEAA